MALDEIKTHLASRDAEVRGRAMQALLALAREDEDVHQEALAIFMGALEYEDAPWAAISAARGIALIAGDGEGRYAWARLLSHAKAEIVGAAASVVEPVMAPALLDAFEKRAEGTVQIPAMRALGRMKYTQAFDAIVKRLAVRPLKAHAAAALGDLGDRRAVEHLKPLLDDKADAWRDDNHGPMLRVCDVARASIKRLDPTVLPPSAPPPPSRTQAWRAHPPVSPTPTAAPRAPAPAPAARAPAPPSERAPLERPALEPTEKAPATARKSRFEPKAKPKTKSGAVFLYVPLVAGLIGLPWFAIVAFWVLYTTGTFKPTDAETQTLDLIALGPPTLGLIAGLFALSRGGPRTTTEKLCYAAGMILCSALAFSFGWEYFHPDVVR